MFDLKRTDAPKDAPKIRKPEILHSLKLTANAPENQWLEDEISFGDTLFTGAMLVLGRVVDNTVYILGCAYRDELT